mgnify:FL=1
MDDYFDKLMLMANYNKVSPELRSKIVDTSFALRNAMLEFNELGYDISFTLNIPNIEDVDSQIHRNNIEQD